MDPNEYRNDPTLNDAMQQLAAMEAEAPAPEQAAAAAPAAESATTTEKPSAAAGQRAPEPGKETAKSPDSKDATGAPATEVKKSPEQEKPVEKPGEGQSKFAKNQSRLEGSWKQLNERKAEVEKTAQALQQREAELTKKVRDLEQRQQQLEQPKYQPKDYTAAAENWDKEADALEARADKLEETGKFDQAEKLRKQATGMRTRSEQAREYADHLTKNPPPAPKTDAQAEAEFRAQQKEWWGKAAIDYPAVAKAGTPEAEALKALINSEPAVINDPKGMYYAARLVTAETSAARVPVLDKELGELRAKVKELSDKLAVPGDGAATTSNGEISFEAKSETEQEAELYRIAEQMDARR